MTQRPYQQSRPTYSPRDTGPSYGTVLEEIRTAGMVETLTEVVVSPVADNEYLCIVRATCVMPPLREGDPLRRYSGLGAAYPRKTGPNVIHGVSNPIYYIHTAESRAKKRAWMDALGRGDGLESDVRVEVLAERARSQGTGVVVSALPAVSNPDAKINEELAARLANATNVDISVTREYTRAKAALIVRELQAKRASEEQEN